MPRSLATLVAVLAFASPALADTVLYTPPLRQGSINSDASCQAINVGKKPISVTVDVLNLGANVLSTRTDTLDPGHGSGTLNVYLSGAPGYCRFTFKGSRKDVRGSFVVVGPGPDFLTLDVVAAQ